MSVQRLHPRDGPIEFVAVGHLAVDRLGGERLPGGAVAYASLTAARLGLRTAMLTAAGEDFEWLDRLGEVEIHLHASDESTSFENDYSGRERRQRLRGRARTLTEADFESLRPLLAEDAAVLYAPIARELELPLAPLARRGRCGVAAQGFFRRWDEEGWIRPGAWEAAPGARGPVDLVTISAEDLPPGAPLDLPVETGILAVTEGENGARIRIGGREHRIEAFPAARVVDPTGAGDVFAASFLVALREGRPPLEAARFACCAASFAVEALGIEGAPPGRAAVDQRLGGDRNGRSRVARR